MSKPEDLPFVINFKSPHSPNNYGTTAFASTSSPRGSNGDPTTNILSNNNESSHSDVRTTPSTFYCLYGKSSVGMRDHCHRQRSEGVDVKARKKLIVASVLCLFFMICEIIGGVLSNSLAIATDAAHLLTDFASFMISLFAIWIAGRPSTQRMSFGWYRAEVIGAMASVVMIWVITAILVWLAIQRLIHGDFEVDAVIMLITSGLAILVNVIMGVQLQHGHSHGGMTSSHGHSHGSDIKMIKTIKGPQKENFKTSAETSGLSLRAEPNKLPSTENQIASATVPVSDSEKPEVGFTEMDAVDAEMPASGLSTFSYQNSKSVNEVQAEIAAVMAETAPGAHHHGGEAGKMAVNMNVRAAFIHVVGDMIQSMGVFVAALVIYFRPDWMIVDPICTFIFSIIVLFTTFAIMKDALLVLMEGTPSYMHYTEVRNIFLDIEGVEQVHNLRIWALSINKIALSVHLAIAPNADPKLILDRATTAVHRRYNFFETTIQIEDVTPAMENCKQCNEPDLLR